MVGVRSLNRLTAVQVKTNIKPGLLADGGGLYLTTTANGTKSWIFRFMLDGRSRDMGLGPTYTISLSEARLRAAECRRMVHDRIDPIETRDAEHRRRKLERSRILTFAEVAELYIQAHRAGWSNAKHVYQVERQLRTIAGDVIGKMPVQEIDTDQILKILRPIWNTQTVTAKRTRVKVESVLDFAKVSGYRTGENPARWKGHLDHLLPSPSKILVYEHFEAMPYPELPAFMKQLAPLETSTGLALQFMILTATRTTETLGARWAEMNEAEGYWTIPPARMKARREHRIPLSQQCLAILAGAKPRIEKPGQFVFPGRGGAKPLSSMALLMQLRRMKHGDVTGHGFRSTFRTWAGEKTDYPREVVETALSHIVGNKVENAYWRGDMFDRRKALMDDWANFACDVTKPPDRPSDEASAPEPSHPAPSGAS